jgi:hypothetical protein
LTCLKARDAAVSTESAAGSVQPPRPDRGNAFQENTVNQHDNSDEPVPWVQQLLDNPFLLLFIGVLIPMVVYTLWGVIDILTIPLAK